MGTKKLTRLNSRKPLPRIIQVANLLKSLSDLTRLNIFSLLAAGERNVTAISQCIGAGLPSVTNHLRILRYNGLVVPRRQGSRTFYSLSGTAKSLVMVIRKLGGPGSPYDSRKAGH
jgi:DNA-binding transcriptional ArsR family regulator